MASARKGSHHWVDEDVGIRLRNLRKAAGLTQEQLGKEVGVSFQQIQKYENGTNRFAVSMLYELTRALHLPMSALLPEEVSRTKSGRVRHQPAANIAA